MSIKAKFMELAASISLSSTKQERIGAVISKKNRVVSWGVNSQKTHPIQRIYNKKFRFIDNVGEPGIDVSFIHAEMDALNRSKGKDLRGHTIYIYRENYDGDLCMCRPCKGCMQALIDRGIKKVIYTTPNGYAVETIL